MLSTTLGIVSGLSVCIYSKQVDTSQPWYISLIIALIPPIVGCICDILVKKGVMSDKRRKQIEDATKEALKEKEDKEKENK